MDALTSEVLLITCMRRYAADPLSLGHIEERMAARGVGVDGPTMHGGAIKHLVCSMLELKTFRGVRVLLATTLTMYLVHKNQPEGQSRLQPARVTSWLFKRLQAHKRKLMKDRNQRWSSTSTQVY